MAHEGQRRCYRSVTKQVGGEESLIDNLFFFVMSWEMETAQVDQLNTAIEHPNQ